MAIDLEENKSNELTNNKQTKNRHNNNDSDT